MLILISSMLINCQSETTEEISEKKTVVLTEENFPNFISKIKVNLINNSLKIDSFLEKKIKGTLSKKDFLDIIEIMKIPENINVSELDNINRSLGIYDFIKKERNNKSRSNLRGECLFKIKKGKGQEKSVKARGAMCERCCNRLVKVRNAMLDECGKQVFGMTQICQIAVTLAYWKRSSEC